MIITEMNVVRTPIQRIISSALNLLTMGKFDELKKKYSDKLNNSCSIHIRRGDYLNLSDHHPVQEMIYYTEAISIMGKDKTFFIFSVFFVFLLSYQKKNKNKKEKKNFFIYKFKKIHYNQNEL